MVLSNNISFFVRKITCVQLTWLVTLACSIMVRASAVSPLIAHPRCVSISMIFSMDVASRSLDCTRFSTPRTTPSGVAIPTVVLPSLMASIAYSTWNRRPSGEKVFTPRSSTSQPSHSTVHFFADLPYSDRVRNIFDEGEIGPEWRLSPNITCASRPRRPTCERFLKWSARRRVIDEE